MYAVNVTLTLYAASLEEAKSIQEQIFDSIEQGVTTPCEQGVFAIQIGNLMTHNRGVVGHRERVSEQESR